MKSDVRGIHIGDITELGNVVALVPSSTHTWPDRDNTSPSPATS
ncbi:MAG: hypothetical protein O6951_06750 [Actinobacteria bacterium]|nr:hypothetical protein [Actinomycetota bacterium]